MLRGFWRSRRWHRPLAIIFLLLLLLYGVDGRIRPMITTIAGNQARVFATHAIQRSVVEELEDYTVSYVDLVQVKIDREERVTSLQTDAVRLNLLQAKLTTAASERLEKLDSQQIRIPIGTLIGWQPLSGRGTRIPFRIIPAGFVSSELQHRFEEAGINQTRHQIMLLLHANIIAVLPGFSSATEVTSEILLAETVIVGIPPQEYTNVEGANEKTFDIVGNYAD